MAGSDLEAVETFISITGASEEVAIRKLEDYHGDLNQAVNAYFSEGDRNIIRTAPTVTPEDDVMDIDEPFHIQTGRTPFPLLSSAINTSPFSLLDSEFRRSIFDSGTAFTSHEPFVSHPREVREIPIEVRDGHANPSYSGHAPSIEEITGSAQEHGPEINEPIIIDEEDDEDIQPIPLARTSRRGEGRDVLPASASQISLPAPSAPGIGDFPDYTNDIEEEMIRAAIEASKKDAGEVHLGRNFDFGNNSEGQSQPIAEDSQLARAVSLSLKAAEQESAVHDLGDNAGEAQNTDEKEDSPELITSNRRLAVASSSFQDEVEDAEDHPLVRHRSTRNSSSHSAKETGDAEVSASSSAEQHTVSDTAQNRNVENFDEWGGISSEEHDEAVMLEAALFGGIPESNYNFPYTRQQFVQNGLGANQGLYPQRIPRSPSPGLTAQRMIREQQDDEYLASLQADREKELKALEEAEVLRLEEQAVIDAAAEAERRKEEELRKKLEEEQEMERHLAAKEASLPMEPMSDDENAVTLLVRMPDGSRHGRRFLKSDKLQSLFYFIDVGRVVKPGSYRLVRPYPRRAFSEGESASSMNELGLTSKQEALFLELI